MRLTDGTVLLYLTCTDLCFRVCYLSLDLNLENGTDDGQHVANDDEEVPAVHKLKLV